MRDNEIKPSLAVDRWEIEVLLMLMGLTVPKLLLILGIGLLVFGPGKLPLVGKSLGKSVREFKSAVTEDEKAEPKQLAQAETKTETAAK